MASPFRTDAPDRDTQHKRTDLRYRVKQLTKRATINRSLSHLLRKLNPILRGWGYFYRFCTGAGQLFASVVASQGARGMRGCRGIDQHVSRSLPIRITTAPSLAASCKTRWQSTPL